MKKYIFLFAFLAIIAGVSGCMPNAVSESDASKWTVIQYSGGKEIGRWYIDRYPAPGNSGVWRFSNGDTVFCLSGDIRVYHVSENK
ncbi:MAG TPA: hypothetical protein VFA55_10470 [Candidatus Kapabacteria bacterium]|nr:hypothetical protein [Candidatus Kapabacteria bacterium]